MIDIRHRVDPQSDEGPGRRRPDGLGYCDPLFATFYSLTLGQLTITVFGVLVIGAEFSTGTICSTLVAAPQREKLYLAKVLAVTLTMLGVTLLTVPVTFFAAQSGLGRYKIGLGDRGVPAAMAGPVL